MEKLMKLQEKFRCGVMILCQRGGFDNKVPPDIQEPEILSGIIREHLRFSLNHEFKYATVHWESMIGLIKVLNCIVFHCLTLSSTVNPYLMLYMYNETRHGVYVKDTITTQGWKCQPKVMLWNDIKVIRFVKNGGNRMYP